jgi:hypothetical protein
MSVNSLAMQKVIVPIGDRGGEEGGTGGRGNRKPKPAVANPGESLIETRLELEVFYK